MTAHRDLDRRMIRVASSALLLAGIGSAGMIAPDDVRADAGAPPIVGGGVLAVTPSTIQFGVRYPGSPPLDRFVTFQNFGDAPYQVLTAASHDPEFEVVTAVPFSVNPGQLVTMTVRFAEDELGAHSSWVAFTTDLSPPGPWGINLYGQTAMEGGTAAVFGSPFDFGAARQGTSEQLEVRVRNLSYAPLTILSASLGGSTFQLVDWPGSVVVPGGGNSMYPVKVRFPRTAVGSFGDTLRLTTSDQAAPALSVPIAGIALSHPSATFDASGIAPVELLAGTGEAQSVVIGNVGTEEPLAVSAAVVVDAILPDASAIGPEGGATDEGLPNQPLPQLRHDGGGHVWEVQPDGSIGAGDPGSFVFGFKRDNFTAQAEAEAEDGGRTLRLQRSIPPLRYEREVHVSPSSSFVRYLDTVKNVSTFPLTASILIDSQIDLVAPRLIFAGPDGGSFDPADDWVVVQDDADGKAVVHVVAGPDALLRPTVATLTAGRNLRYNYDFLLAPGASASILHFGIQGELGDALALAEALRRPSGAALTGLSAAERRSIVNFGMAGKFRLPATSLLIPPGGSAALEVTHEAPFAAIDVTTQGTLHLTTDDPLHPTFLVPLSLHVTGAPDEVVDGELPGDRAFVALAARFVPNPAVGRGLRLAFALPTAGDASFELYDVRGSRIATRTISGAAAGRGILDWTISGVALPPGVYWTRLTHAGSSVTTKGVVLK